MSELRKWLDKEHGRVTLLAAEVGVTAGAVVHWTNRRIPLERVPSVSRATGIIPHKLRPDVFAPRDKGAVI